VLAATAVLATQTAWAQEDVGLLAGCWLAEGAEGDRLVLDPRGSYRLGGDAGRWSADNESISFRPTRDRSEVWDLSLMDGVLTLSSPRERRRVGGETVETPLEAGGERLFRRAPHAECGLRAELPAPIEAEPPADFVPAEGGILLTNPRRNDPVEVRPPMEGGPMWVCEIDEGVCQPVAAEALVFEGRQAALLPSDAGGGAAANVSVWVLGGGEVEGGGLVGLDGLPCVTEEGAVCQASQGYLVLVDDASGSLVTGLVALATVRPPAFERAILAPPAGETSALLWIESGHHREREGEYRWQAFSVRPREDRVDGDDDEAGLSLLSVAGPFQTGVYQVESVAAGDPTGPCRQEQRNAPEIDPADGRVTLVTDLEAAVEQAWHRVLVWAPDIGRYQAWTLTRGPAPAPERVCGQ
jgi:hypothetical protein